MTPREFRAAIKAHNDKEEVLNRRTAWLAANIMNCWSKKTIKPEQLLGKQGSAPTFASKEELRAYMNAKKARQRAKDGD